MLSCLGILVLATVAATAAADPYRTTEYWELARSPGGSQLASLLSRSEPAVAARAALALGRTGKLLAADPLLQHTQAGDIAIRAMVVYGLGLLAPALSGKTLQPMLSPLAADRRARAADAIVTAITDDAPVVRIAALDAAARFAYAGNFTLAQRARATNEAIHTVRADEVPAVRGRAAYALAYLGKDKSVHTRVLRALEGAYGSEDDERARWHVMWALAISFAKDVSGKTLAAGLADQSEIVKLQTLHALERRKSKAWIPQISSLAVSPSWRLNEEAREALRVLRGGKRTEHLTAIPAGVMTPQPMSPPQLSPLERPHFTGKPSRPSLAQLRLRPHVLPETVETMTGPMPGAHPRVAIVTNKGTLQLILYPEWAPETVTNFLELANRGFYDGIRPFRIVPDFVVQSGDRTNTGDGDAGYRIRNEENPIEQDTGIISMGLDYDKNGAVRDSAGSQFYITLSPQLHLDRDFTVFGRVESGFDVLGRLVESDRILRIEQLPDGEPERQP